MQSIGAAGLAAGTSAGLAAVGAGIGLGVTEASKGFTNGKKEEEDQGAEIIDPEMKELKEKEGGDSEL